MMGRGEKTGERGIYRTNDKRLRIYVSAVNPDTGKREYRQKTMPKGATMSEAIQAREEVYQEIKTPAPLETTPEFESIRTVRHYGVYWFGQIAPTLSPRTREVYKYALDQRVLPYLGDVLVDKVSRAHVKDWVAELDKARKSKKQGGGTYALSTRRRWWRVGKQMLRDMRADLEIHRYLVDRVKPPQKGGGNPRERRVLSRDQLEAFADAAGELALQRHAEMVVLATTGMRIGELYGLCWDAIDHEAKRITIWRSATKGRLRETTKTGASRTVPLAPRAAVLLHGQKKAQMDTDDSTIHSRLVFPSNSGRCRYSSSPMKAMKACSLSVGLDFTVSPQVIRRSVNSIVTKQRLDVALSREHEEAQGHVLRAVMGHTSKEMTGLYTGVSMDDKHALMAAALGPIYYGMDG